MTDTAQRARDVRAALDGPIPALFCIAGTALTVVGCVPWFAAAAGAQNGTSWVIRVIAGLAVIVGIFVVLVGIGLFRARNAMRAAAAETALDDELLAAAATASAGAAGGAAGGTDLTHEACASTGADTATACATCDASCALSAFR